MTIVVMALACMPKSDIGVKRTQAQHVAQKGQVRSPFSKLGLPVNQQLHFALFACEEGACFALSVFRINLLIRPCPASSDPSSATQSTTLLIRSVLLQRNMRPILPSRIKSARHKYPRQAFPNQAGNHVAIAWHHTAASCYEAFIAGNKTISLHKLSALRSYAAWSTVPCARSAETLVFNQYAC